MYTHLQFLTIQKGHLPEKIADALSTLRGNQLPYSVTSQVAAWVPDMFCNFYLVKSHKIANNSATTEAREKKHRFGIIII